MPESTRPSCDVANCCRPVKARGLCHSHYVTDWRHRTGRTSPQEGDGGWQLGRAGVSTAQLTKRFQLAPTYEPAQTWTGREVLSRVWGDR